MIDLDIKKIEGIIRHVAATEVLPRFKNLQAGDIREKKPGDFVTIADEESEKLFTKLLQEVLPDSLVVGEEAVAKDRSVLNKLKDNNPVWVIDPIDGTYNFAHGRSHFGILIALVQNGVTQYGFAYDVIGDRMAVAKKGAGIFIDGVKITINCNAQDMSQLRGQLGGAQPWHFDAIRSDFKEVRNFRCSLHDAFAYLTGEADFVLHVGQSTPWDHAAAHLMVEEAGGFVGMNEKGDAYDPTYCGPAITLVTPSREWWEVLHPALQAKLQRTFSPQKLKP